MPKKASTKVNKKAPVAAKVAKAVKPATKKTVVAKAPAKPVKVAKTIKPAAKAAKPAKAVKSAKSKPAKTGPKKGQGRVTSPSGPLSAAVVSVLKRFKRPLSCREICDQLLKKGYVFTHPEPRRILSIRIYKLKGVKKVSTGRFTFV